MKRLLLFTICLLCASSVYAIDISRLEPACWWVGMKNPELQIMVYGKNIASSQDYIDYPGIAEEPVTLGKDEYFCLGDNRPVSQDSRYEIVGPVKRSQIVGKVWIRIWPLNKFGKVS